jgi:hypothetical protein
MKNIFLISFCIFLSFSVFAQWTSVINPSSYSTYGTDIILDNQGNIYSLGHVFVNSTEKEDVIIVKYTNTGTVLWTRIYGNSENSDKPSSAVIDADNNLIIVGTTTSSANGDDIMCLKYNSDGDLIKTYVFDGTAHLDDSGADIVIGESGNLYIGGTSRLVSQRAFVLIKTDSDLEEIWQKTYTLFYGADLRKIHFNSVTQNVAITGNYTDWENLYLTAVVVYDKDGEKIYDEYYRTLENRSSVAFDVIANNDNSIYVCGYEANEESNLWDALLLKYNSDGEVLWSKKVPAETLSAYFNSMIVDGSGNIYLNGMIGQHTITVKYDSEGNQSWLQTHTSKSGFSTVDTHESIKQSVDGDIFVTARNTAANGGGAMIVKYNNIGEHQWTQYYNGSTSQLDEPLSFCLDNSGNSYLIVNSRNSNYYFDMATVMFLNQSGQTSPLFGVNNNLNIYPNPAETHCVVENPNSINAILEIYSTDGKIVYKSEVGQGLNTISVQDLPSGMYFIQLKSDSELYSTKFLIQK